MSAAVDLVEVGEPGVNRLNPAARGSPDLAGNVVKPTGTLTDGGASPLAPAAARTCPNSQYHRAAEVPVPVSQYNVMLSTMVSRVRLPTGFPSMNAREIL